MRAATSVTAPGDGWASLGAGNRAIGPVDGDAEAGAFGALPNAMDGLRRRNDRLGSGVHVGALGTALRAAGAERVAFGSGAAIALADDSGSSYEIGRPPDGLSGANFTGRLAAAVQNRAVVVIEMRQLVADTTPAGLAELDALVGETVKLLTPQDTLLIAGVSDRVGDSAQLRVAIARGPGFRPGVLRSGSTRRNGFVQLIDLGPTVLRLENLPVPAAMVGRPWTGVGSPAASLSGRVDGLVDADRAADGYRRYAALFFLLLVLAQVVVYTGAFFAMRARLRLRSRVLAATRGFALAFAAVPAATYLANLVHWWRHPFGYLLAAVAAIAAVACAAAALGPWRRHQLGPEGFIAGTTFAVIAIDLLTGARLQLSSVAGYSPIVAGRFAGIGNVAFAIYGTAALLLTAALCARANAARAVRVVVLIGLLAIVIDGNPLWGSDFGGVLALVPAFAALGLMMTSRRVSWRAMLAIALGAVTIVAAFALADYARPAESQTHLGRFVGQLLHGGAGSVVSRKARANLHLLTHSLLTLALPPVIAFAALLLFRPRGGLRRAFDALPALRAGLIAVLVMGVAGFVFNDSGLAVPALALTVAVPLAVATSMQYADAPDTAYDAGE